MINAILNGLLNFMAGVVDGLLAPVNTVILSAFPDFSNYIADFDRYVDFYIGNNLAYFTSMLPKSTINLLVLYLTTLINFMTITIIIHTLLKVFRMIKNIKFW